MILPETMACVFVPGSVRAQRCIAVPALPLVMGSTGRWWDHFVLFVQDGFSGFPAANVPP